jgi:3-hydroxy-3-methylglutaryl CoA synthase
MPHKARNIGILGIEIAFPRLYVNQKELGNSKYI